jgi:hypothetical protein
LTKIWTFLSFCYLKFCIFHAISLSCKFLVVRPKLSQVKHITWVTYLCIHTLLGVTIPCNLVLALKFNPRIHMPFSAPPTVLFNESFREHWWLQCQEKPLVLQEHK